MNAEENRTLQRLGERVASLEAKVQIVLWSLGVIFTAIAGQTVVMVATR